MFISIIDYVVLGQNVYLLDSGEKLIINILKGDVSKPTTSNRSNSSTYATGTSVTALAENFESNYGVDDDEEEWRDTEDAVQGNALKTKQTRKSNTSKVVSKKTVSYGKKLVQELIMIYDI